MFAGDRDRDRATVTLREHYARGRLTLDEFSSRTARVLTARSREELARTLSDLPQGVFAGLPVILDTGDLAAQGRLVVQKAVRGALLVLLTGAYLLFSFALLFVLGLTLLIHGVSGSILVGFLVVWLVPTFLLSRLWLRKPHRRGAG
jgi:Flp pilus assembly protein TadB